MQVVLDDEIVAILNLAKSCPSETLENEQVEFKEFSSERAVHNSKDLAEEISALSNKGGGVIIIGVRDSSNVSDQDWLSQLVGAPQLDLLETQERLKGKLQPMIDLKLRDLTFEGRRFIAIHIPSKKDSLVATSSGKVCIRDGRSSRPMSPSEIQEAVKSLQSYDWSVELIDASIQNVIDETALEEAFSDFRSRRKISEDLNEVSFLEAIGATRNGRLTKGGVLFLGKKEIVRELLGDFEYRFSWKTRSGELLINEVWDGSLWNAIQKTKELFNQCNKYSEFEFEGKDYEAPLLDPAAFHEAFLNALVHRDYSIDGMVSVNFTGHKLTITSPGNFYGGVTADNIALHEPRHRNKALAKTLMLYNLIDRAGMGVLRMGLRSLMYGRSFPNFIEKFDSIEVSMHAEYLRPAIFVMTQENPDRYGIPELLLMNNVYEAGYAPVKILEHQLRKLTDAPWKAILDAIDTEESLELCGNKSGVFVRAKDEWAKFYKVGKSFRTHAASDKHVKTYSFLKKHGASSNEDITELLGHNHSSQTSAFLRGAEYVQRTGHGPSARWYLIEDS